MVIPRSACSSVRHSVGDTVAPDRVIRLAAHHARNSGSVGAIMKSECSDTGMPARAMEPARTICPARSGPRPRIE